MVKTLSTPHKVREGKNVLPEICVKTGQKYYIHHRCVSRYASHLYRDTFAEALGSGGVGTANLFLLDVSDITYFFFSGEGKWESEAPGKGRGLFFLENHMRGSVPGERGGGRGAGRVSAGRRGGGEAKYVYRGRNPHRVLHVSTDLDTSPT